MIELKLKKEWKIWSNQSLQFHENNQSLEWILDICDEGSFWNFDVFSLNLKFRLDMIMNYFDLNIIFIKLYLRFEMKFPSNNFLISQFIKVNNSLYHEVLRKQQPFWKMFKRYCMVNLQTFITYSKSNPTNVNERMIIKET